MVPLLHIAIKYDHRHRVWAPTPSVNFIDTIRPRLPAIISHSCVLSMAYPELSGPRWFVCKIIPCGHNGPLLHTFAGFGGFLSEKTIYFSFLLKFCQTAPKPPNGRTAIPENCAVPGGFEDGVIKRVVHEPVSIPAPFPLRHPGGEAPNRRRRAGGLVGSHGDATPSVNNSP